MLLNLVDSNLQTGDDPLVPYTEITGDDGLLEYRFRYPISLSDIKIDLQSIFNDPDFSDYTIGIYYRLDENENNPKQIIRLEDISNDSYDYDNGFTDITGLVSENNGYVELKTKLKIGCKVFGVVVEKISLVNSLNNGLSNVFKFEDNLNNEIEGGWIPEKVAITPTGYLYMNPVDEGLTEFDGKFLATFYISEM